MYVSLYHPMTTHPHLCKGFEPGTKRKMKFQQPVCFSTPACLWPRRISALRCIHRAIHPILQPLLEIQMNQTKAYEKTYPQFFVTSVSFCFTVAFYTALYRFNNYGWFIRPRSGHHCPFNSAFGWKRRLKYKKEINLV